MSFKSVWRFDPDEVMKAQRFVPVSRMGSNPPMKPTRNVSHASRRISTRRYMSYAECSDCNSVGVLKITCDVIAAPHDLSDIKSVAARRKRTLRTGEHDDDTN